MVRDVFVPAGWPWHGTVLNAALYHTALMTTQCDSLDLPADRQNVKKKLHKHNFVNPEVNPQSKLVAPKPNFQLQMHSHLIQFFFNKTSEKTLQTAHLRLNSVCSKPKIYPSSEILHDQRSPRSLHFSCRFMTLITCRTNELNNSQNMKWFQKSLACLLEGYLLLSS